MDFINREDELERIGERLDSEKAEFLILYGRRRVGKSELIRQTLKNQEDSVYFQATESTSEIQIQDFADSAAKEFPTASQLKQDWETLLKSLAEKDATVVIDEFPFLVESDSSVPSIFQRFWDQQESSINLVLIGSSISVMEDKVLSGSSPLYGRWTQKIDLEPLKFDDATKFFEGYSPEEKVEMWSILGGTPHYLKSVNPENSLRDNINRLLLSENGRFRDEPEFLLRMELDRPQRYMSILKAMASGKTRRNSIAQAAGIDSSNIGTYISKLERLQLVERQVPVTEEPPRSRRGIYTISEPLIRFWFRYVFGNEDRLRLQDDPFQETVEDGLNDYVSTYFEKLCREKLPGLLERDYERIGGWWYQEHEIDVVGLKEDGKVLGECKYTESQVGKSLLDTLKRKEDEIRVEGSTEYALFSKTGFTEKLREEASENQNVHLFSLEEIVNG